MSEEAKVAFQKFEASGFLPRMRELVMRRCAPFFWSTQQDALKPPRLLHNGTICYVDTGRRHIGITADHVYRQYLKDLDDTKMFRPSSEDRPSIRRSGSSTVTGSWTSPRSTCRQSS